MVLPKFSTSERDALTPELGMIIYNADEDRFQGFIKYGELYSVERSSAQCSLVGDGDLSFNYIKIEPDTDLRVTAFDLLSLGDLGLTNGLIEVVSGSPCGTWSQLAVSQGTPEYLGMLYYRYYLSSTIDLQSGGEYYIRTLSGNVYASFGCNYGNPQDAVCRLVNYSDLGPYCTDQTNSPYCNIIGEKWTNLHE